jgi:glycine cleavage system regulatory protein
MCVSRTLRMSKTSLVLTVLGSDRPGLVESLARVVAEHGGNWVESRMAHLAGHFAGILRVEIDADRADALAAALSNLNQSGLESIVHPDASPKASSDQPVVRLDLVGQDRPGIVREISRVLAAQGVNVEDLHTECVAAAESGQQLFRATARLRLPAGISEASLRTALEAVAADLMVDLDLAAGD